MAKTTSSRKSVKSPISIYNVLIVIVILAVVSVVVASFYGKDSPPDSGPPESTAPTTSTTTLPPSPPLGNLVIAVKDSYKIAGGYTILGINITMNNVSIDEPGACCNQSEWRLLSDEEKTVGLLDYTDTRAIVAETEMYEEEYSKIQLGIASADITVKNDLIYLYRGRTYPLELSSNPIELEYNFTVEADKTTVLTLDFEIEGSITKTSEGFAINPMISIAEETLSVGEEIENSERI